MGRASRVDADGALYSLWTEPKGVRLARSSDLGKTWQEWLVVETKEMTAFFPYLIGRRTGELAATWFTAQMPGFTALRAHVARLQASNGSDPPAVRTASFAIDATTGTAPTPAGEYVPALFLRDGRLTVVTPVQNRTAKRLGFSFWTMGD